MAAIGIRLDGTAIHYKLYASTFEWLDW